MSGGVQPIEVLEIILGVGCPPRRGLKDLMKSGGAAGARCTGGSVSRWPPVRGFATCRPVELTNVLLDRVSGVNWRLYGCRALSKSSWLCLFEARHGDLQRECTAPRGRARSRGMGMLLTSAAHQVPELCHHAMSRRCHMHVQEMPHTAEYYQQAEQRNYEDEWIYFINLRGWYSGCHER